MKKFLRLALWPIYFIVTLDERNRYLRGTVKGYHCIRMSHGLATIECEYDPSRKPEKEYMTLKEYMNTVPKCEHESIEYSGAYEDFLEEEGKNRMVLECKKCGETYFNPLTLADIRR